MRTLRLLVSLSTSLTGFALLLYMVLASSKDEEQEIISANSESSQANFKALFSFASPGSLFPPSAIISLTDDNSTFFLARPAAFGPALPKDGLSGSLWIGSGFGDNTMGRGGELGCSDVPGWDDGSDSYPPLAHPSTHADIQSLQEAAEIAGKVVLLQRGGCGFLAKVQWAQSRGGVAVIVGDHVRGGALVRMYAQGDTSNVTIPSLFTSYTTARLLSTLVPAEGMLSDAGYASAKSHESGTDQQHVDRPDSTSRAKASKLPHAPSLKGDDASAKEKEATEDNRPGWLHSLFSTLAFGGHGTLPKAGTRRPPSSGHLDWIEVGDLEDDQSPIRTKSVVPTSTSTHVSDGFVIGKQDWRDPDLLPMTSLKTRARSTSSAVPTSTAGGNALPGSGEYTSVERIGSRAKSWWDIWLGSKRISQPSLDHKHARSTRFASGPDLKKLTTSSSSSGPHEGLWVTLTPTNISTSPFFDTLLVLVISPLVTLTVVYALLLLRSRIRRRRWRAPKSVVERLPVRTYQTVSGPSSAATTRAASPTTPLLQHVPSPSISPVSRSQSPVEPDSQATSTSVRHGSRDREEEKRESGLAAWRRRYGGRQKECVVCLEEYVNGISQVMSLPCGHEFHADCITPWLVTRRRTCPICKGDVVRSLSQSWHDRLHSSSPTRSPHPPEEEDVQSQAAYARNESPSASRPVPVFRSASSDSLHPSPPDEDVEPGLSNDSSRIPEPSAVESLRELASSVGTVVWRGVDAVRTTTGFQRRSPPPENVDRDR